MWQQCLHRRLGRDQRDRERWLEGWWQTASPRVRHEQRLRLLDDRPQRREKAEKEDDVQVDFQIPKPPEAADQKTIVEKCDHQSRRHRDLARGCEEPDGNAERRGGEDARHHAGQRRAAEQPPLLHRHGQPRGGLKLGEEIKKSLPNGGQIVVFVGQLDAQNAVDRISGIEEALKGSNVRIIDKRTDGADHAKAKSNAADILVKNPDVAALVGIWSYNGPAILSAVQDANKVGKVKILCFDEEPNTLAGVKSGAIDATIVQQPYEFGYRSVILMAKYLRGDKSAFPASKQMIIDTRILHKGDVDAFKADLDKKRAG